MQIKFRGFRKDGTMLIGDLNHIYGYLHIFPRGENAGLDSPDNYEIVPESLSMFTGLTDKNGKQIFGSIPIDGVMSMGGDVLTCYDLKVAIVFEAGQFVGKHLNNDRMAELQNRNWIQFEIIGNQYDKTQ